MPAYRFGDIAEVTDFVANGSFASLKANVIYRDEPDYAVLVRLTDYKAEWKGDYVYVPEASYKFLRKSSLVAGDIVISNVGAYAGTVFRVPDLGQPMTLGPNAVLVRFQDRNDANYMYYYLTSHLGQSQLQSIVSGSAQPKFNKTDLRNLNVVLPDKALQIQIATILSAYDNLIENNTRRIKILEQMAELIYREWFVNFRFPGHEDVEMVESELGMVPEGWRIRRVEDVLRFHIGGGWGKEVQSEQYNSPANVIRGTDISGVRFGDVTTVPLRFHTPSNLKERRLEPGDIVFEVSGGSKDQPTGRALLISSAILNEFKQDVICASFCKRLQIKNEALSSEQLYFHLKRLYDSREIEKYEVQSTGIKNFKFAYFLSEEKLHIPPLKVTQAFSKVVGPLLALAQTLGIMNRNLRQTRDMLLPKLISGELEVSSLSVRDAVSV